MEYNIPLFSSDFFLITVVMQSVQGRIKMFGPLGKGMFDEFAYGMKVKDAPLRQYGHPLCLDGKVYFYCRHSVLYTALPQVTKYVCT